MRKTAFILDNVVISPERQIPRHIQETWELSYIVRGKGIRMIGNAKDSIIPGEVILIPPGIPHEWKFDHSDCDENGNIRNITLMFKTETLSALSACLPELESSLASFLSLKNAVKYTGENSRRIACALIELANMNARSRIPGIFELLSWLGDTRGAVAFGYEKEVSLTEKRLDALRIFCETNYSRHISLSDIAGYVGMNKSSLCVFVKAHTGNTVSAYLNDVRLRKAVEMLRRDNSSISAVAYSCGYASVSYFNRVFRRKFGCIPKQYVP